MENTNLYNGFTYTDEQAASIRKHFRAGLDTRTTDSLEAPQIASGAFSSGMPLTTSPMLQVVEIIQELIAETPKESEK